MNPKGMSGVWFPRATMDGLVDCFAGSTVTQDELLEREFEQRLARVSDDGLFALQVDVLRNQSEAEDVAQRKRCSARTEVFDSSVTVTGFAPGACAHDVATGP